MKANLMFAVSKIVKSDFEGIVYPCIKIFDEEYSDEISLSDFIRMIDLPKSKYSPEGSVDILDGRCARYSEGKILIVLKNSEVIPPRVLREREYEVPHTEVRTFYRAAVQTMESLESLEYMKSEGESFKYENLREVG